jgi:hypothetical protein
MTLASVSLISVFSERLGSPEGTPLWSLGMYRRKEQMYDLEPGTHENSLC